MNSSTTTTIDPLTVLCVCVPMKIAAKIASLVVLLLLQLLLLLQHSQQQVQAVVASGTLVVTFA